MLTTQDREILRRLGAEYMEYASLPVQKEKRDLWKALNRCEMARPMVNIDQLPWNELNDTGELTCQVSDPWWQEFEKGLRRTLYQWRHFPADMVLEPFLTIPLSLGTNGYGLAAQCDSRVQHVGETATARHYNTVLAEMEDLEKIQDLEIQYDAKESRLHLEEAEEIFQGIAPVIAGHGMTFHVGVWDKLSEYMGVEQVFYDIVDRPEFLHAPMRRITDATLAGIRQASALRVVDDIAKTCHCSYTYNDEQLPDFGTGKGSISQNSWAFGLAQVLTSVSPAAFEEFELPYITEMAREFDRIYYGCCDRLDNKLDLVRKIPNVRKVSCSPWSNRKAFAEKLGPGLILSNKPTPAFLAAGQMDEDAIREDLEFTCRCAKENSVPVEFILKDISTVQFEPTRLTRWAEIAMETVQNW